MKLHTRKSIVSLPLESWEVVAFESFSNTLGSTHERFPCSLGVAGFNADHLRFVFIDEVPNSVSAIEKLSAYLQTYLIPAREFGKNTSLVVFFNENRDLGVDAFEKIFWEVLNGLSKLDVKPWPSKVPLSTESSIWEFCFGGEPIFVVCNTPSHRVRRSRFSSVFTITFQPRWVFEGVIGLGAPNGAKIKDEIRRRLVAYDGVPPSPFLGSYGDEGNQEWRQYFLEETNRVEERQCPFRQHSSIQSFSVVRTLLTDLQAVVKTLLPQTGSVEVQLDTPFRRHSPHRHPTDETLHIINGNITFEIGDAEVICSPGDRLLLPRNTEHASTAGESGCEYVIATRLVFPESNQCKSGGEIYA